MSGAARSQPYVLGHADRELERLAAQSRLVGPITRRIFLEAGIAPGMRVLDVGSGGGDVSLLLAELVGPAGEVVGADRSAVAIAAATRRIKAEGLANVRFVEGDPAVLAFDAPFDAVAGRYVLMFQPDPAAMLRGLARQLLPGGLLVFHELDWAGARSYPPVPAYDRAVQWIMRSLERSGADPHFAGKFAACLRVAGLPDGRMRLESLASAGTDAAELAGFTADLARTLLPAILKQGIATEAGVGIDTLAARIRDELGANAATITGRAEIGAWTRIAGTR